MELTLKDLLQVLKTWDEVFLLETLGLTSEQLVDRFEDVIEEKFDDLCSEVEQIPSVYDEDEIDISDEEEHTGFQIKDQDGEDL